MRFIPIGGFLLLVLLLGFLLVSKPSSNPESGLGDKPLPMLHLNSLDGKGTWKKENVLGHVTVLNFFASWCVPCQSEMPEMAAMKKAFPKVQFTGVAWNDEQAKIGKFLKASGDPFNTVWTDPNGETTIALGLRGIPETFIVDANGHVRFRLSGPLTPALRASTIDPLLKQLLEEAAHAQ